MINVNKERPLVRSFFFVLFVNKILVNIIKIGIDFLFVGCYNNNISDRYYFEVNYGQII